MILDSAHIPFIIFIIYMFSYISFCVFNNSFKFLLLIIICHVLMVLMLYGTEVGMFSLFSVWNCADCYVHHKGKKLRERLLLAIFLILDI
jgi:hypothetical protein